MIITAVMGGAVVAQARDDVHYLSVKDALQSPKAKEALNPNVELVFGRSKGSVIKRNLVSSRKTNAFNKSTEAACIWAFLSSAKNLQDKAARSGATKVMNIVSYYDRRSHSNTSEYECHTGSVIAGVVLKVDYAR